MGLVSYDPRAGLAPTLATFVVLRACERATHAPPRSVSRLITGTGVLVRPLGSRSVRLNRAGFAFPDFQAGDPAPHPGSRGARAGPPSAARPEPLPARSGEARAETAPQ